MKKTINEMQNPAGDMMLEIQEQDLAAPVGGSVEGGDEQNVTPVISAVTAVSALSAWSHDKITRKFKCGEVLTASAECSTTGNAC
jgi:hypothetical protein